MRTHDQSRPGMLREQLQQISACGSKPACQRRMVKDSHQDAFVTA